jgi:hypothetical protein
MPKKPPIALIIFSNDLDNYLSNIETERKVIEEALEHYDDTNRLKVITRSSVSIAELFRLFNKYSGRIVLFHFAGHAAGNGLQFNQDIVDTETGKAEGIADLFKREIDHGILKFVFLNGCSTAGQVEQLKAVGVPSVIATHYPINDNQAVNFAAIFYKTWAKSDNLATAFDTPFITIQTAFKTALAYLKSRYTVSVQEKIQDETRGFVLEISELKTEIAWELFTTTPDQTLDFDIGKESKTFNELLTRRLIEILLPYSNSASKFLPLANKKAIDWETDLRISNKAKEVIVYSYIGVLGIQLQKIFAIGKEDLFITKQRKYIETCLFTAKRTLKLVNFALLSTLWDFRMNNHQYKDFQLDTKQQQALTNFFDDDFELNIQGYFDLLIVIYSIYKSNNLAFPFAGLEDFEKHFEANSALTTACAKLQKINQTLDSSRFKLEDCFSAEKQLTTILETFVFLSEYKMVSIRNIAYNEMRNQKPQYIHTYTALGIDAKQNVNAEQVRSHDRPISTDAILLYKGNYQNSINLFPFIIDMNTLTFEDKTKICFYDSKDLNDGSLNYCFLKDNKIVNIVFKDVVHKTNNMEAIIEDNELLKVLKLDMVHSQFYEAKKMILGEDGGESDDDFGDLFGDDF